MSDQDLFGGDTPTQTTDETVAPALDKIDLFVDKLASITREDGTPKYESLEQALDALSHSQTFIPTLQSENKTLREQKEGLELELERVRTTSKSIDDLLQRRQEPMSDTSQPTSGLDNQEEATLESQVARILADREAQQNEVTKKHQASKNLETVTQTLISKYGDKAKALVDAKAAELGLTPQLLQTIAAESPQAFLAYFERTSGSTGPAKSSVNTAAFTQRPKDISLRPERSVMSGAGANDADTSAYLARIREKVYKDFGIN